MKTTLIILCPLVLVAGLWLILPAAASIPEGGPSYQDTRLSMPYGDQQDCFGHAVSISGDCSILGAPGDDDNGDDAGAAHVFRYDTDSVMWFEEAKLLASDGELGDEFGYCVAQVGDVALIGAPRDVTAGGLGTGSVYVFRYDSGSATWTEETKLLASDGADADLFGCSVAISGDSALIGACGDEDLGAGSGSAYVFRYDPAGGTWSEKLKVVASDGAAQDRFGNCVSFSGNIALIGAQGKDDSGNNSGAAYVFRYDPGTGNLNEEAKLLASDGAATDVFGCSVSVSGNFALIGANGVEFDRGAAYVFRYDPGAQSWFEHFKLVASDGSNGDEFGTSVTLAGGIALVGAPGENGPTTESGAVYVFRYNPGSDTWHEKIKLLSSYANKGARLGHSTSLSGYRALCGAPGDFTNGPGRGAGYVYGLSPSSPLQIDIKCNGQDEGVVVTSATNVKLNISIIAGRLAGHTMDVWVLLRTGGGGQYSYGNLYGSPRWQSGWGNEYLTGWMRNHFATVLDRTLPVGQYKAYLCIESDANGNFNVPFVICYDVVDFEVVP